MARRVHKLNGLQGAEINWSTEHRDEMISRALRRDCPHGALSRWSTGHNFDIICRVHRLNVLGPHGEEIRWSLGLRDGMDCKMHCHYLGHKQEMGCFAGDRYRTFHKVQRHGVLLSRSLGHKDKMFPRCLYC